MHGSVCHSPDFSSGDEAWGKKKEDFKIERNLWMYYLCGWFLAIYMKHTVMELKMTAQYDGKPACIFSELIPEYALLYWKTKLHTNQCIFMSTTFLFSIK